MRKRSMKPLMILLLAILLSPCMNAQIPNQFGYEIGTTWVYEAEQPMSFGKIYPVIISIVDTATVNDTLAFYLESETIYTSTNALFLDHARYMYVEGPRVYFYHNELEHFVMNYDYSNPANYFVPWTGAAFDGQGVAEVVLDNLVNVDLPNGQQISVQQVTVSNSGTYEENWMTEIYEGIGSNDYFRMYLGHGLSDGDYITKLRCFSPGMSSGNEDLVFVTYPCDSSWVRPIVNTLEPGNVLELTISPNPTRDGQLSIGGLHPGAVYDYQLMELSGRIITNGRQTGSELNLNIGAGIYLLRLETRNGAHVQKLVVH